MDSARDSRYPARLESNALENRAPVAQLDRVLPSEGRGHTFESCRARQEIKDLGHFSGGLFLWYGIRTEICASAGNPDTLQLPALAPFRGAALGPW